MMAVLYILLAIVGAFVYLLMGKIARRLGGGLAIPAMMICPWLKDSEHQTIKEWFNDKVETCGEGWFAIACWPVMLVLLIVLSYVITVCFFGYKFICKTGLALAGAKLGRWAIQP